jgi:hypothetical protein
MCFTGKYTAGIRILDILVSKTFKYQTMLCLITELFDILMDALKRHPEIDFD